MKATGIVRRIDDLGRVVIPKEIRRTMRIREGEPLEIFTDREGKIILKKYSPISELAVFSEEYAKSLSKTTGYTVCITDKDQVAAVSGQGKKELQEKGITQSLSTMIQNRESVVVNQSEKKYFQVVEDQETQYEWIVLVPIICEGDVIGGVLLLIKDEKKKIGEAELILAKTAADFLGKQMEQ